MSFWTPLTASPTSAVTHTHSYTATGVYTVSLTATGPGGSDTLTRTNYVTVSGSSPPPVAGFTGSPLSDYAPLTVTFTNATSGEVTGYEWAYGDGVTGTTSAVTHTHAYTASGVYTVSLTATGPGGSDTLTRTNYVTVTSSSHTTTTRVITYTYDALNRLTGADYSTGETFAYRYDEVGNRTTMTETNSLDQTTVTTYTYDAANRLLVSLSPGRLISYTWDARGNLVGDGTFTYTYNAAGRMVRAESVTATLVYTYNAQGLQVAQSVDGDETTFAWDQALPLAQVMARSDGTLDLYGLARTGEAQGGEWTYPLPDALGSVRQWSDSSGAVTYAGGYTPFGTEMWHQGSTTSAWGYTGEWQDPNAEMVYLRARWYAPYLNRFISLDPIVPDFRNPQSIHRYAYVENNPINFIDPSGYCANDCGRFVDEVECFVASAQFHKLLGIPLNDNWIVHMLGGYYAGFRMTQNVFGCTLAIPPLFIVRDPTPERWPTPSSLLWRALEAPPIEGAEEEALSYGFKRIFYNNTHHYFG